MTCSICKDPAKSVWVAERKAMGMSANAMERMSKGDQSVVKPMKRETILKHLNHAGNVAAGLPTTALPPAEAQVTQKDLAALVQVEVIKKVEAGEARVTVQHGLQAQQMLDRRAERIKDRELAVTLARMLHSELPPDSLIEARPVVTIEGEVERVG